MLLNGILHINIFVFIGVIFVHDQPPVIAPRAIDFSDPNDYRDMGGVLKNNSIIAHGTIIKIKSLLTF